MGPTKRHGAATAKKQRAAKRRHSAGFARRSPPAAAETRLLRIGLVFGYGLAFYRDILHGVKAFAAERPHWALTPDRTRSPGA